MVPVESSQVVVVDDSLTDAELTIHALQVNGHAPRVTWLCSAEEALLYMSRTGQSRNLEHGAPNLVLLEVDMPGIGGIEVLSRLKRDPFTSEVPVVMLSARHDPNSIRRCYELGANSYLAKPVAAIEYFQKIRAVANYWLILNEQIDVSDISTLQARRVRLSFPAHCYCSKLKSPAHRR